MNLLDMLDRLETGIAALRARASNGDQRPAGRSGGKAQAKRKKSSGKKRAPAKQTVPVPSSELATEGATTEPAARVIGKRQALGRSLLQLRRPHGDTPGPH